MSASWRGVRIMAAHEFRLRLRSGRWMWLLGAWFVALLGFTVLERFALSRIETRDLGTPMLGGLMLLVLALGLLVVPALSGQSINGDRERGVLATLQTTLLTPMEITLGKLAAAWGTALVFLATTLPLVVWCFIEGGVSVARVVVTVLVVALLLGVLAAVALALSALLARSTTSAVLAYLTVFALTAGTLITFGLGLAATSTRQTVTEQRSLSDGGPVAYETTVAHPERIWWTLAPNPFVILADAAPRLSPARDPVTGEMVTNPADPLGAMSEAIRDTRREQPSSIEPLRSDQPEPAPVWPFGLAFHLVLGILSVRVTARRLQTPYRTLPRAVRVA
jgi:ABC-2 type transport system permease protein